MNTFQIKINANVVWGVSQTTSGAFIAECEPLGLILEGENEADLRETIAESLNFFFLNHFEDGTLKEFLSKRGWELEGKLPQMNRLPEGAQVRFDVPWNISNHAA